MDDTPCQFLLSLLSPALTTWIYHNDQHKMSMPPTQGLTSPITSQAQQVRPKGVRQKVQLPLLQDPVIQQRLKNLRYLHHATCATAAAAALLLLLLPVVLPLDVFLTARN
jgi:hypothetical protein